MATFFAPAPNAETVEPVWPTLERLTAELDLEIEWECGFHENGACRPATVWTLEPDTLTRLARFGAPLRFALFPVSVGIEADDPAARTYPSRDPRKGIDRIYASTQFDVREARVVDDPTARAGSDHLPVVADLTIR